MQFPPDDPRHGTYAGAQLHRKCGERPCFPCMLAARDYMREYRKRRGPALDNWWVETRDRALQELARRHPAELRRLIEDQRRQIARPS